MPMVVGPDGTITVPIEANADAAAKEIEAAFSSAIARAMADPKVRAAVVGMVKHVLAEITKIPKATDKAWQASIKQSQSAAKAMAAAFKAMGKAATDATKIPSGTNASYNTLTQQIAAMANNMEDLANATKIQRDLIIDLARSTRTAARLQTQENRDALQAAAQADRNRIAADQAKSAQLRASSTQRVAILNAFSKQALQIERTLTRVFELTWKSAERAVRAFARGASAVLHGLGTTAASVFTGIGRAVSGFVRNAARAFSTLGRGVGTALGAVSRAITSALRRDENAYRTSFRNRERLQAQSLGRQAQAQQRFQTQQRSGLLGGLSGGAIGGLAGGAGILSLLTSGFERAGQQELLQLTFSTLLQDGPKATAILQQISDFARTTSFDFVEVASSVAQFTATLGDVGQAFDITKFLADVVALTGGTTESLGRVRLAMTQIASAGRLDAANLKQLTESLPGVPFAQILADRFFGGDIAAYSAARDAGELGATISAEAFFDAFQQGVTERFPEVTGFAQVAATTLTGLAQNLKENFSIFGATIIKLVEGPLKRFIGGVTQALSVAGAFISGTMFSGDRGTNPFAALAASDPNAEVNIADLPQAAQDVLRAQFGFTDESFVSATDAADIWEKFTPPAEVNERLKELRDTLGDIAKTVGGVLAVASGFKILKLAMIALTSPLALVVLGSAAVGTLWSRMLGSSLKLRGAFAGLKAAFAGLREAVGGVLEVVGGIASSALFGNKDFFKGLGNSVARFVNYIRRGLVILARWLKMFEFFLRIGQGGRFLVANLQKLGTAIGDFGENIATSLFGINPFAAFAAESQGGNDVLNLLERTFLGPIVRFFRGPFLDGIKGIGGFLDDIFNAIFGGDEASGAGVAFRDAEGDSGGIGTRILNVLKGTFIGPITEFFRGPFADFFETIGGGIADFGGFLGDIFNAIFGDDPGGIGTRILDVLDATFLGPVVRFFRGPFADGVESVAGFVVDAFRSIVDAFQAIGTLIEPFTDAIGHAFRSLFGGGADGKGAFPTGEKGGFSGIWEGLKQSLGDIGTKVTELLGPIWTSIKDWFSTTFSAANVIGVAKDIGNIIREVGRVLGLLVSEPAFVLALAGLALALTAAIGFALVGVFEGLASNAGEWAGLIIDAIVATVESLVNLIPGVDIDLSGVGDTIAAALAGVFSGLASNPIFTIALTAFALLRFAPTVLAALGAGLSQIPIVGSTFGGFVSKFSKGLKKELSMPGAVTDFRNIGLAIGAAVMGGVAAFEIGRYAGRSGSTGGLLLAILGGAATGAAIGSMFSPVIGTAIGAALGGGLAAIGAEFGKNAKAAEEARDRVNEYAAALEGLSGPELQLTGTRTFLDSVIADLKDNQTALQAIAEGGLPAADLFAAVDASGLAEFNELLLPFIERISEMQGITPAATSAFDALVGSIGEVPFVVQDLGELEHALDFLRDRGLLSDSQVEALKGAFDELGASGLDLNAIIKALFQNADATDTALSFNELRGQIQLTGEAAAKVFSGPDGSQFAKSINGLQAPLEDFQAAIDDAQSALEDLLNVGTYRGSFQALHDELQSTFSGLPEALASGLEGVKPEDVEAETRRIVGPIGDTFGELFASAVDTGLITNVPQLDAFQAELSSRILAMDLSPQAEQILLTAVEGLDTPEIRAQIEAKSAAALELIAQGLTPTEGKFDNIGLGIVTDIGTTIFGFAGTPQPQLAQAGTAIAEQIAASITASKSITNAIGSQIAGTFTSKPTSAPATPSAGVEVDDSGVADARKLVSQINAILIAGVIRAAQAGQAIGKAITAGIAAGGRGAVTAGQAIGKAVTAGIAAGGRGAVLAGATLGLGASLAASQFAGAAYSAGQSIGQGLASGIASMARQVASAAAAIAFIAVYAARKVLQSSSPSQVFHNIGRDVGEGFIEGIKESEGSMIDAISSAIEKAVTAGAERAGRAIAQAQVGQAIFDNLAPGILPGGATSLNIAASRTALQQGISGFAGDLRGGAAGALGDNSNQALFEARNAVNGLLLDLRLGFEQTRDDYQAARTAAAELSAYDMRLRSINRGLTEGILSQTQYNDRLRDLGDRPAPLNLSQRDLLSNSPNTLSTGTLAGRANNETVGAALGTIREFGAAALEAGRPLAEVVRQMAQYTASVRAQAQAQGLVGASLDKLIAAYGLSGPALAQFVANLTSLDATTAAGAENVAKITDQLQAIRDYGSELLAAGYNQATVITQLREFRDQLVRQATAFGFSRAAIDALVNAAGLGNTALNDFIRQLNDFNREAREAAAVAEEAARAAREKKAAEEAAAAAAGKSPGLQTGAGINRALVENLNIYPVTGNPEAIGLGVVNRLSYGLLTSG